MKFGDIHLGDDNDDGSISPRILFTALNDSTVRRRLDISFSRLMKGDELSPVSFTVSASASASASAARSFSEGSVGECFICYTNLPLRANHIFTMCGHLYCVRCLLKWWDTSTTCPVCRAELYDEPDAETDAETEAVVVVVDAEGGDDISI
jgi:hypothetical protein